MGFMGLLSETDVYVYVEVQPHDKEGDMHKRKILGIVFGVFLCVVLTTGFAFMGSAMVGLEECPHDGDVNQDGEITPQDALMAFEYYLGISILDDCRQAHAEVTLDGEITPKDALCIFQKYLGIPCCLDAQGLVEEGKACLEAHQLILADQKFKDALSADPDHYEANFFAAFTQLAAFIQTPDPELQQMVQAFGGWSNYDVYDLEVDFPEDIPVGAPTSGQIQQFITDKLYPLIDTSIQYLGKAERNEAFSTTITPAMMVDIAGDVQVDLIDVKGLKALLDLVKFYMLYCDAYELDMDLHQLQQAMEMEGSCFFTYIQDMVDLFTLKQDIGVSKLLEAKSSLQDAIDTLQDAADRVKYPRTGHIFNIEDQEDWEDFQNFKNLLGEIEAALAGPADLTVGPDPDDTIRVDFSRLFDGSIDDFKALFPDFDAEDCIPMCGTYPDPTLGGVFPEFTQEDLYSIFDECALHVPYATITLDGEKTDWAGITPIAITEECPDLCRPGMDAKALYVARDADNLYWMMEVDDPPVAQDACVSYTCNFSVNEDYEPWQYPILQCHVSKDSAEIGIWFRYQWTHLAAPQVGLGTVVEAKIPLSLLEHLESPPPSRLWVDSYISCWGPGCEPECEVWVGEGRLILE